MRHDTHIDLKRGLRTNVFPTKFGFKVQSWEVFKPLGVVDVFDSSNALGTHAFIEVHKSVAATDVVPRGSHWTYGGATAFVLAPMPHLALDMVEAVQRFKGDAVVPFICKSDRRLACSRVNGQRRSCGLRSNDRIRESCDNRRLACNIVGQLVQSLRWAADAVESEATPRLCSNEKSSVSSCDGSAGSVLV